jgi:hypothetical protein
MREALTMVYALHKFKHYLLGNRLVSFIDHIAFVYLINKPQISSKITRWFLLFLEYDFKIVYKIGDPILMANALRDYPTNKTSWCTLLNH